MTTEKAGGRAGDLQLNIGSSIGDLQTLCRNKDGPAIYCLYMSG